jgi:SAM-dependent methyltransferase
MKVDLGCGTKKKAGYIGIDIVSNPEVDIVHDLNEGIPLKDNVAEVINASYFLEFIKDENKNFIMNEIWRVLCPGGVFICESQSTDGRGAFSNPYHRSYWNENSFLFYVKDELRKEYEVEAKFSVVVLRTMPKDKNGNAIVGLRMKAVKENVKVPSRRYTIVCASNNDKILKENLLKSKGLKDHQLIIQKGFKNVPKAYNEATLKAEEDIIIYVHHDVYLPDEFFADLDSAILNLDGEDWGVLGVAGCVGSKRYGHLQNRKSMWGSKALVPYEVETLDELILIIRKGNVLFDENIPSTHHMFGPDSCLQCTDKGLKNYAIDAFCVHNCALHTTYPKDFYDSAEYIKKKWKKYLPITTTCTVIK